MSGPERDPEVDAWLRARRPKLRLSDPAESLEPPEELDRLVLDRARRELRRQPAQKPGFFSSSRFAVPVSIAATLVLSFTLVLQFNRYESRQDTAATLASAPKTPAMTLTPAATPETISAEARTADAAADHDHADVAPVPKGRSRNAAGSRALVAQNAAPTPAAPAFMPDAAAAATAKAAPARSIDAGTESRRQDIETDKAAGTAMRSGALAAAIEAAPSATLASAAAPQPGSPAQLPTPAQWWAEVRRLQREGRSADAARELAALRKAYPDFVAPAAESPAAESPAAAPPPQPSRH
jgi:hypothetical protein